jgi:membrane-associated PAP2 superfamily phosphatase
MPRLPLRAVRGELVVVVAILAAATVVFRATGLDLAVADAFREPCCSWPVAEQPLWRLLYRYGVFAGVLLAAGALVTFTLSYWYPSRLLAWRRPALFLVLVAALGPGLLINVVFKDHYGRPRPREVQELGGQERFLPVWTKGSDPQAKSFPCGHCSMGFYLSTPYLVLRRRRRKTAIAVGLLGLAYGGLMGVARMAAGGHFLSDVVWAGGMTWLVAIGLYLVLDVDRPPAPDAPPRDLRKARLATAGAGALLGLLTLAALLATPYISSKRFARTAAQVAASPARAFEVSLDEATVSIEAAAGDDLQAAYDVQAFGLPTSKLGFGWRERPELAVLSIDRMGWFTERRTSVRLQLPRDGARPILLRLGKGKVALDLRGFSPGARLDVEVGEGEVRVLGAEAIDRDRVVVRVARGEVIRL